MQKRRFWYNVKVGGKMANKILTIGVSLDEKELNFLKKLAEKDGFNPKTELAILAKLQLREEIELDEEREGN